MPVLVGMPGGPIVVFAGPPPPDGPEPPPAADDSCAKPTEGGLNLKTEYTFFCVEVVRRGIIS